VPGGNRKKFNLTLKDKNKVNVFVGDCRRKQTAERGRQTQKKKELRESAGWRWRRLGKIHTKFEKRKTVENLLNSNQRKD
jgi:hypothetical protein